MSKRLQTAVLFLMLATCLASAAEVIPTNSVWRLRKGTSEASSPVDAWRGLGFNEAAAGFTNALAPFWYGDAYPGGTHLPDMQNGYSCVFLRRTFHIGNAAQVTSVRLRALVDDGFVAWINGVEVARTNVTVSAPAYQTLASNATEPPPLATYYLASPLNYLVTGSNVLAVQVFNTSLGSSDFGFDALLDLTIAENPRVPPTITSIQPSPGTVSALTSIAVTFSEPVMGLDADDFLINGVPISTVTANGTTYVFEFPEPPYGTVYIGWAQGHGITDLATPSNAFNATAADWQYELRDNVPPGVAALHPPAGLTVSSLTEITVTFSEAVQGVEAADLLINGEPAQEVFFDGTAYRFRFAAPAAGPVSVAWANGHGIEDLATLPNSFAGGTWNYLLEPKAPLPNLVINEFLAGAIGTNVLVDENREAQDWIELHNRGTNAVNLAGWSLSDDPALPGLWTFPERILGPNEYLVIFASGKDRRPTTPGSRLHTNFKLGNDGEHLGLYTPDSPRELAHGFPLYPEQRNDISYGYDAGENLRYFTVLTPGGPNALSSISGVCAPVQANVQRGHFVNPFDLVLTCATPGVTVRYTTDGSEPTTQSPEFPGRLRVTKTTLLRAAAFRPDTLPSRTMTHSYFFNLSPGLRSLPAISIVTSTNHLYGPSGILGIQGGTYSSGAWQAVAPGDYHNPSKHGLAWERPVSMEWIEPTDHSGFQIDCGIRVHGSDWNRPRITPTTKTSFRLYFRRDYGPGRLDYPLFPLTEVQRFDQLVLRAGFNEQNNPFIRDELARRVSHDMGQIAAHGTVAVVFINGVPHAASPWYNPTERIHEEFFQEHLGGGENWDVVRPPWSEGGGAVDGTFTDFQSMVSYVTGNNPLLPGIYTTIARRLDLTNFVDYCLLNAYAGMGDWPQNNWRAGREISANGIWRFACWDSEWGFGIYDRSPLAINSFTLNSNTDPFLSGLANSSEIARIYQKLRTSPEFRLLWADRVQKHFFNGGALTGASISNRVQELKNQLSILIPGMDSKILEWVRDRQPVFFNQMDSFGLLASSNAPVFSQFGGRVPLGFSLVMTSGTGTIYYTTNGSDPRTAFTGAPAPGSIAYTAPLLLLQDAGIRARTLAGTNWSAVTEATFRVGALGVPVRITELMYNPAGGSLHEYIELQNTSAAAVELGGMYFEGITYRFDMGTVLAGGARLVLGSSTDTNAWKAQYPGVTAAGWFSGSLNNAGERISVYDRFGNLVTFVEYGDDGAWPSAPDGTRGSLEIVNVHGNANDPANWQASEGAKGSPGAANSLPTIAAVRLNEVMADNVSAVNNGGGFPDWVEVHNTGSNSVNLAGWSLSDGSNPRQFVFPSVTLPAKGFLVLWCDAATNTAPGLHTGFALSRSGDGVFLYDAATNRVDAVSFGAQIANFTLGRAGAEWLLCAPTPNAENVVAPVSSATNLIINEWMADPVPGEDDWVELFNRSGAFPVSLNGLYLGTSNALQRLQWHSFIPPLGHLQLLANESAGKDRLSFRLPATGGALELFDASGGSVQKLVYGQQTQGVSQGRMPSGAYNVLNFRGSASPGASNYIIGYSGPVINEVLARNQSIPVDGKVVDFVELRNPGTEGFDLGGMSLSVDTVQPGAFVFPANTVMPAGAHLVIRCDSAMPVSTNAGSFNTGAALKGEGGGVYLFSTAGQLVNSVEYGFQVADMPIGLSGGQWRLLAMPSPGQLNGQPAVAGLHQALRFNEWMPLPLQGDDWFELYNTTNRPVDLSTVTLTDDPSLAGQARFRPAPLSFIGPGGFVLWQANDDAGDGKDHVNFALNAAGDYLAMYGVENSQYRLIDAVGFGAHSAGISSGRLLDGAANIFPFPGSESPGRSNYRLLESVVINEALAHTDPPLEDAVELHNQSGTPVNVNGWYLSNSREQLRKYQITNTAPIPPGGYLVLYQDQFDSGYVTNAFALNSAHGEELWLTAAHAGVETGERGVVRFGASFNGVSFGRVRTSEGIDFWPLTSRSFGVDGPVSLAEFRTGKGGPNSGPAVGPIVINEIHYNPAGAVNGSEEFVELHNAGKQAAALFDPDHATNRWRLGGGIAFAMPGGVVLPGDGYALVVGFDPAADPARLAAFRSQFAVEQTVPVFGPFDGKLANEGDTVELLRPDRPQQPGSVEPGYVPYVVADRVSFRAAAPWPGGTVNGGGHSLQRVAPTLYGNEPLYWMPGSPTPGKANAGDPADTDKDGIPDWAELQMGLDPLNGLDAALDADGDRMSNHHEFLAGTDHLDPASALKFDRITSGSGVMLRFRTMPGKSYSVLYKDSLSEPSWTKLVDLPASLAAGEKEVMDPAGTAAGRFYLLTTPAQ